jgi:hypothetical protein
MSTITKSAHTAQTVQNIILAEAGAMIKDVVGFLAIATFVVAVLIWAY